MKLNVELLDYNVTKRVKSDIEQNNICGCSVAVTDKTATVYTKHFGCLSAENPEPLGDNTLFRMASMTKPVTAAAILTLFDRGLIDINAPVEKYLPQLGNRYIVKSENGVPKFVKSAENMLTVKHLLTHTSGILAGECGAYYSQHLPESTNRDLKSTVDYYAEAGLSFEPFSATEYSAVAAFDVLARIIEVISGIEYNEYIKRYITDPCGMINTTFTPTQSQWSAVIPMHNKRDGKSEVFNMEPDCVFEKTPCTHFLGGAGLISSLSDYLRFAKMLLNNGTIDGNRVLSENAIQLMSTPQVPESIMPGNERWGLGVRVIVSDAYKYLPTGTFGWSGAYGTHFWIDPVNEIAAVYMKNSMFDGGSGAITAANFEKDIFGSFE